MYVVTRGDTEIQWAARNFERMNPDAQGVVDAIRLEREMTDAKAKMTNHGRLAGYLGDPDRSGVKVIGHIPFEMLWFNRQVDPNWGNDPKELRRFLKEFPDFRATSPEF